ncbi:4-phosphopantetheinyl transferase family protein [Dyadobacter flavalbus]|uniref:4-phosphopantetheinyl transferase family protein n=1 Tax=Dyadobacter flavalbus TaxID=2579942 RepID=A0A5M8QVK9_9BACT|nr:4'-phosphopantetheinyl transferase superfamily protein [Dyadobacter flavalbus]KAA6438453.1 4-phosphopantetheinyl transferase family protein [Dyadobacter flavalbus]
MIGNDLVDLHCASIESNWERKGFLDKLFTATEKAHIHSGADPFLQVWKYWTMKEAAYKIYSRMTGIRNFAPPKLCCTPGEHHYGTVLTDGLKFYTCTDTTDNYIHTTAALHSGQLADIRIEIIHYLGEMPAYASKNPACVSHHGQYLALIY